MNRISAAVLPLLLLSGCGSSGGGGEDVTPAAPQASAPTPRPATLFYRHTISLIQSDTNNQAEAIAFFGEWPFVSVVGERLLLNWAEAKPIESMDFGGQDRRAITDFQGQLAGGVQGRVVYSRYDGDWYSVLPDGSDTRQLTQLSRTVEGDPRSTGMRGSVGSLIVFGLVPETGGLADLAAVPVLGGPVTLLAEGPAVEVFGAAIGNRLVYHACVNEGFGRVGQCDLYSVLSTGADRRTLSTHHWNERVQGVIEGRVLVRRNSGAATDELYSVAPEGGSEQPVATLNNASEFVVGTVAGKIVLRRGSALWTMQADGSDVKRLTDTTVPEEFAGIVGDWIVTHRRPNQQSDVWAVPAVGDGEPVAIARTDADEFFLAGVSR